MPVLFTDTFCSKDYWEYSWEEIYELFKYEGPRVTQRTITIDDSTLVSNTTYNDVVNYFLHRILAKTKILPYTDMVQWVIDNLSINDRKIAKKSTHSLGLFLVRACGGCTIYMRNNANTIRNTSRHLLKTLNMH